MHLRCSVLGHEFGEAVLDERREERPRGTVLVVREYRACRRCGLEEEFYENEGLISPGEADRQRGSNPEDTATGAPGETRPETAGEPTATEETGPSTGDHEKPTAAGSGETDRPPVPTPGGQGGPIRGPGSASGDDGAGETAPSPGTSVANPGDAPRVTVDGGSVTSLDGTGDTDAETDGTPEMDTDGDVAEGDESAVDATGDARGTTGVEAPGVAGSEGAGTHRSREATASNREVTGGIREATGSTREGSRERSTERTRTSDQPGGDVGADGPADGGVEVFTSDDSDGGTEESSSVGAAEPRFRCPECGFEEPAEGSPRHEGDSCTRCLDGFIEYAPAGSA